MKQSLLILLCCIGSLVLRAQTGPWTQRNDFGFPSPNGPVAGSAGLAFGIGSVGYVAAQAVDASGDSLKSWFGQYDPATNTWTRKSVHPGFGGIGFTIGGKGYMMSGSLWQYDPVTDTWTQLANYPDAASTFPSTAFSIGSKGYVGGGRFFIGTGYTVIFYEYDPATNVFTRKANLPDPLGQGGRAGDVSFSIGNKGYWGTGSNDQNFNSPTTYDDFYEYDPSTDTWTQKANVGGSARSAGVGFSIGNLGYIGMGAGPIDRSSGTPNYPFLKDFWQYDPSTDTWTQKADFGGGTVVGAAGFTILDKGYAGSGQIGACGQCGFKPSADFWQYDPATDQWRQIAGFVKQEPINGIRFSVNGKGYLGPNSVSNNIWEYDTLADSWSQKAAFPGALRSGITGFSIGDKAYAGTGVSASLGYYNDFWEFDPILNTWTAKANFGGGPRTSAMGFGIGSKGYMGTGTTDGNNRAAGKKDMWEYDPSIDTWTQKADFGGSPRYGSLTFTIGNMGYVAFGSDTTNATFGRTHDFWQYDPSTDTWTQKADFAGGNRMGPTGFGLLGKGYIGMGTADAPPQLPDFWQYDPTADTWTRIADFPGGNRIGANSLAIGQKAYIGSGQGHNATVLNDLWQFDPSGSTPLPLTLTGFTAVYTDPATLLHWQTDQEQNTSLFTIQRSTDAKHFSSIGTVAAAGHSTSPKQYSFTDEDAAKTGVPELFYRLQEADLDGRLTLSPIVSVNINRLNKGILVTPNPATDNITVQIGADAVTRAALVITDPAGRELVRQDLSLYTGNNSYPLAVGSLPAGVYYIVVRSSSQNWQAKFIKK